MDLVKKCFAVPPFQSADFAFDKFFLDGGIGRNGIYHLKNRVVHSKNGKGGVRMVTLPFGVPLNMEGENVCFIILVAIYRSVLDFCCHKFLAHRVFL